jgi:hypothetical protein
MAEYRLGHFESAVEWAQKAAASTFRNAQAESDAVLAMAEFQLNKKDEARTALEQCAKVVQAMPALDSGDLGGDWRDWIISHTLLEEARTLIADKTPQNQTLPPK